MSTSTGLSFLAVVAFFIGLWPSTSDALTFSNSGFILIPAAGSGTTTGAPATPYPSSITVSGVTGVVVDVNVTLTNMNHTFSSDIDILLVGPTGAKLLIMSDAGGAGDFGNKTYTFDDAAATLLSSSSFVSASGTYQPSNFGTGDTFPAPAPAGPYTDPQSLSIFNGLDPNGTWSLFVVDDANLDVGFIDAGWSLEITVAGAVPEPTTLLLVGAGLLGLTVHRRRRES